MARLRHTQSTPSPSYDKRMKVTVSPAPLLVGGDRLETPLTRCWFQASIKAVLLLAIVAKYLSGADFPTQESLKQQSIHKRFGAEAVAGCPRRSLSALSTSQRLTFVTFRGHIKWRQLAVSLLPFHKRAGSPPERGYIHPRCVLVIIANTMSEVIRRCGPWWQAILHQRQGAMLKYVAP